MKAAFVTSGEAPGIDALTQALSRAGIETRHINLSGTGLISRLQLDRQLRRLSPDCVVACSATAAQAIRPGPFKLLGRPGAARSLAPFSGCQGLIAVTQAQAKWMATQGWPPTKIHTVPDLIAGHTGALPAQLPCPPGTKTALVLAPLTQESGLDVLMAALTRLPTLHAVIAGDGPLRTALPALARQAGVASRTHFLGTPASPAALLAACDVVVCPARHDLTGTAILHAFAAGKPVVATMTESALELMGSGRHGILVPTDSGIALAAGIEGMLANPAMAETMAKEAAAGRHTEAQVVSAWRGVLAEVGRPGALPLDPAGG